MPILQSLMLSFEKSVYTIDSERDSFLHLHDNCSVLRIVRYRLVATDFSNGRVNTMHMGTIPHGSTLVRRVRQTFSIKYLFREAVEICRISAC